MARHVMAFLFSLVANVGRWQSVPALSQRRSSAGVAALEGNLYCVGGSDGSSVLSSAEKFDPRRLRWETIASMNSRR